MLNIIIGIVIGVVAVKLLSVVFKKREKYATVGEKGQYKTLEEAEKAGEKRIKIL